MTGNLYAEVRWSEPHGLWLWRVMDASKPTPLVNHGAAWTRRGAKFAARRKPRTLEDQ